MDVSGDAYEKEIGLIYVDNSQASIDEENNIDIHDPIHIFLQKKTTGPNPRFTCRHCSSYSRCHRIRFVHHLFEEHWKLASVQHYFKLYPLKQQESPSKRIKDISTSTSSECSFEQSASSCSISQFEKENSIQNDIQRIADAINDAASNFCIAYPTPFSICENSDFLNLLQAIFNAGRESAHDVNVEELMLRRTSFTTLTIQNCNQLWSLYISKFSNAATSFKTTLMLDGKTDINGSSLIFFGLHICDNFLWCSYVDPGPLKKDATYLSDLVNSAFKASNQIGSNSLSHFESSVFSTCMDNAAVCSLAGDICQKQYHLVKLNCCLHALALFPAHLFTKIDMFATTLRQVEHLIAFFRKKGRVRKILQAECKLKKKCLLRIIPTRMYSALFAFQRVYDLRKQMLSALNSQAMESYMQSTSDKSEFNQVSSILGSNEFVDRVEFTISTLKPIFIMSKFIDRSDAHSRDAYRLFSLGMESIAMAIQNPQFAKIIPTAVKKKILEIFQNIWSIHFCEAHVVSWVLNPEQHEAIVALSKSTKKEDVEELKHIKKCCEVTFTTIINKMKITDDEIELQSTLSEAYVQLDQYIYHLDETGYNTKTMKLESGERWWLHQPNEILPLIGRIVEAFPCSTSNLERSMKLNNIIHGKYRSNLSHENTISLTRGNQAIKDKQTKTSWSKKDVEGFWRKFEHINDVDEELLDSWYSEEEEYLQRITSNNSSQIDSTNLGTFHSIDDQDNNLDEDPSLYAIDVLTTLTQEIEATQNRNESQQERRYPKRQTSRFNSLLKALSEPQISLSS